MLRNSLRPVSTKDAAAAIDAWLASIASSNTQAAYRADIADFAAWCTAARRSPLTADRAVIDAYRAHVAASGAGPATVSRRVSAVNGFTRFAAYAGSTPSLAPRADAPASPTVPLDDDERDALIDRLGASDRRTGALVALLLLDGLKLDEALRLDAGDLSGRPPTMHAVVRSTTDARRVMLHPHTAALVAPLARRRSPGPLLTTDSRSRAAGQRLTRFGADYLLKQAGRAAGLTAPLTANSLRRTHVIHAHRQGRSVDEIRRHIGHDDVRTTRRYLTPEQAAPGAANPSPSRPAGGTGSRRRPDPRR